MTRFYKIAAIVIALLALIFLGPQAEKPVFDMSWPQLPDQSAELEVAINQRESAFRLKPENAAQIIWANDSLRAATEYALVYIPGFTASHHEGDSVHRSIAKRYGWNLYLARNNEHGLDTSEALIGLTAEKYWEGAKYALAVGKKIGKKVILMSTSTGGTVSLKLAAEFPQEVAGLILYSPNIAINDPNAWLLNNPWGLQIARLVIGGKYIVPTDTTALYKRYWDAPYRIEGAVAVQELVERSMVPETLQKVKQPTLLMYYYQDEENQDPVVKVSAMRAMFKELGTPADQKQDAPMPKTGNHVIATPLKSNDVGGVMEGTAAFLERIYGVQPRM